MKLDREQAEVLYDLMIYSRNSELKWEHGVHSFSVLGMNMTIKFDIYRGRCYVRTPDWNVGVLWDTLLGYAIDENDIVEGNYEAFLNDIALIKMVVSDV